MSKTRTKQSCTNRACGPGPRLLGMLFLTSSFMLVELIVGNLTNSMALVADAFHMMSDVISIIIAYISVRMSPKEWKRNTFGWARAEVVGALINAVFLLALCFSITVSAIKRFLAIENIEDPKLILIVGGLGLLVNLLGMVLFGNAGHGHSHDSDDGTHGHIHDSGHGHSHDSDQGHSHDSGHGHSHDSDHGHSHEKAEGQSPEDGHGHSDGEGNEKEEGKKKDSVSSGHQMNIQGVFLHILADALGSVVVIISALVIWLTDWQFRFYMDPVLSIALVIIITVTTWPLLRDSTLILLNSIPPHINLTDLESRLVSSVAGVTSVHELHVWRLVGKRVVASCHLELDSSTTLAVPQDLHMATAREVKEFFHQEGIHSTTIQLEYPPSNEGQGKSPCQLQCPRKMSLEGEEGVADSCLEASCCRTRRMKDNGHDNMALETDISVVSVVTQM